MQAKHTFRRAVCALLCLLFFALPFSAGAEEPKYPSATEAAAVYFYHLEEQSLIYDKNSSQMMDAGSTVKILAGLLACRALGDQLHSPITVTADMVRHGAGYRLYLQAGDILTAEQLLYAAICGSYNDAYYVLAYAVAGDLESFVALMNTTAKELGATHSVFTDPCGVDDKSTTTAEDLAKIAMAAYENSLYMEICDAPKYTFTGSIKLEPRTIHNRNALIASSSTTQYYNSKCHGMNAGSTNRGGNCVVTVAKDVGQSYLCIVLGGLENESDSYGYTVANRLIDWVFSAYAYMEVISPQTVICTVPVTVSDLTTEVEIKTTESLSCRLPAGVEIGKEITYSIRLLHTSLEAPVSEGTFMGYVAILYDGRVLGTVPLYTAGSAERSNIISSLKAIEDLTQNRKVMAGLIFFTISLTAWIITEQVVASRRRHKWDKYFSMKMQLPADRTRKK